MKKLAQLLSKVSICFAVILWSTSAYGQGVNTPRPLGSTSSNYGYYEYLPVGYNTNTNKYPILIFLHGIGEKGNGSLSSLKEMLYHGPLRETARGRDFPFIVVSPQSPVNWNVDEINKFVEFVKNKYRTNTSKMYMTGLSLGGMATYTYASKYNQQLAAIVPIAGKANLNTICNMSHIPMWAFHGDADGTISVQHDKDAVRKYNSCSPAPSPLAKLTIYPGVGHNSWTRTYDGSAGHDVYKWMLQFTKGSTRTTTNTAPTASAGSDKIITLPTNTLTIYGSASDSDGTISSTNWSKVNGPSASMSGSTTKTLKLSNLLQGTYTFRLTAKDNAGATKYDDVQVTVKSSSTTNAAPSVNAGSDKTITLPTNTLTVYGSASDSDGSIASTNWTKVNGPTASMSGTTTKTLKLTNLVQGTYTFRLTVKDNAGASRYNDMVVTVRAASTSNTAPSVNAGSDKTITLPTNALTIYGSASDSDGTIASTNWTKVNGPTASMSGTTTKTLKLTNLVQGTYTFRLTAKDNAGASRYNDMVVTVKASSTSEPVTSTNGLNYKYYTTSSSRPWKLLPDFSSLTPVKPGTVSNFSLGPKTQYNYFGFVFEGQLQVDVAGTYTFYSYSDDGSQLFIDGKRVVDNNGTHGAQEKYGSIYLGTGRHAIKVTYFDYTNGETLSVRYKGPGITKRLIPNTKLFQGSGSTTSDSPSTDKATYPAPSNLIVKPNSYKTAVGLSWNDNSSSEQAFEIYMSTGNNTSYRSVGSTGANKTSYVVGISSSQTYYFKMRARYSSGYSAYTSEVKVVNGVTSTSTYNAAESKPDNYTLAAPSNVVPDLSSYLTAVRLNWKDNSSNESGFEIYMSIGNTSTYKLVGRTATNRTAYTVGGLSTGKVYYLKVRAINSSGNSAYSSQVMVSTALTSNASISAVQEETTLTQVTAYPNPATDYVHINFGSKFEGNVNVQLVDLGGRVLYRETVNATENNSIQLDLRNKAMNSGIYLIRIENGSTNEVIKLLKR